MNAFGTRSGILIFWLAALAAVLALIGWETDWGRQLTRAPVVPDVAAPAPVTLALLPDYGVEDGVQSRQQTVERPVFVPTRRPAPPALATAQEAAKPRMQKGQFVLTGTAVVEQKSVAFLRESAGGKSRSVRVGETINGLVVAEVKPDRVKLTMGEDSEELLLKVAAGPRTTVQPVQPVAAGGPAPGAPVAGQPGGPAMGGGPAVAVGRRQLPGPAPRARREHTGPGRGRPVRLHEYGGLASRAPARSARRAGGSRSGGTSGPGRTARAAVGPEHDDPRDARGDGPGLGRGLSPHAAAETLTDRMPMRDPRPECRPGDVNASPESPMNPSSPVSPHGRGRVGPARPRQRARPRPRPRRARPERRGYSSTRRPPASPRLSPTWPRAPPIRRRRAIRTGSSRAPASSCKGQQPGGGVPPSPAAPPSGGGVVLNFEGADLREVVRNILGDILGESYTIDPAVGGQVTIRTTSGMPRDALYATLETLLRMNGATMVKAGGLFKIVPQAAAVRGNVTPQLGSTPARAAGGLLGADRAAALRRRARHDAHPRAVRQGRAGGARRRAAQPADPGGHRARAAAPDRDRSTCSTSTGWRACRPACSCCRTPT